MGCGKGAVLVLVGHKPLWQARRCTRKGWVFGLETLVYCIKLNCRVLMIWVFRPWTYVEWVCIDG
jgi:hypothetical protein